ncbi:MAG: N-acetyltransferase family protein [Weeksellaceae bacterium]
MKNTVSIIQLKPDDWHKYKAIRLEALQADPIAFGETYENIQSKPESYWRERLASTESRWIFAQVDEQIVGMMGARISLKNEIQDTAIIVGVYVSTLYRGNGIGKKMLESLLKLLKDLNSVKKVKLWVSETQIAAKKMYEDVGFIYTGTDEKQIEYKNNFYNELILEKILT